MPINMSDSFKSSALAEQTFQLFSAVRVALVVTLINSSILVAVLWPAVDHDVLLIWLSAVVLISAWRSIIAYQYTKVSPASEHVVIWVRRFLIGSLLASLVWGAASVWLFPANDLPRQVFLAFVIGGMAAGSISTLSYLKFAAHSFLIFTLLPLSVRFLYSETELSLTMGLMVLIYFVMMIVAVERAHKYIKQNIYLRNKNIEHENALLNSEQHYKTLLETVTDAFFLHDEKGKFIDVNLRACRELGYSRDELLEMSVSDIEIEPGQEQIKSLSKTLERGGEVLIEGVHRRKNGTVFPVEVSMGLVHVNNETLYSVLARDITNRKQREERIRESQQRLALHVQHTPLGVIEWDTNFCVAEWNPAAEIIFGFTAEEAIGSYAKDLIVPESETMKVDQVWEDLTKAKESISSTNENITKDSNTILCDWYNTPLVNTSGKFIGVASLIKDITKQKKTELALIVAMDKADAANKAKSQFLSHMSHELRTPMSIVIGYCQLIQLNAELNSENRSTIEKILSASNDMMKLVSGILDFSRVETGQVEFLYNNYSLNNMVDECFKAVESIASDHEVKLINNIDRLPNRRVHVDNSRFKQALNNLILNAIKYNVKNGTVSLGCTEVGDGFIRISVSDTGNGLTDQDQQKLFKPFERIGEYKGIDGAGIGLVTSKYLVEAMGGAIGVNSIVNKGSTFWIDVLLSEDD